MQCEDRPALSPAAKKAVAQANIASLIVELTRTLNTHLLDAKKLGLSCRGAMFERKDPIPYFDAESASHHLEIRIGVTTTWETHE